MSTNQLLTSEKEGRNVTNHSHNHNIVQAQVCEISFFLLQKYEEIKGP